MSLYRTWRPKTFAELVGQDAVVRTLSAALESGKLAHAYLFSGPRGSGKTSAAKILARCVNCAAGPAAEPDNTCEHCLAMLAGTALDVLEIDAASNRGIDEIRALREAVRFAPATMRSKVYIIDEAHMLTKEGANAFLRTLEEPPPHVLFILATTEPERLPATILSRCQRYAFRRIAIPVMIARMREVAKAEGIEIGDGALAAIAYRAEGGLRDALTMLEQVATFADGPVDTATVELAFGATGQNYARRLVEQALERNTAGLLGTVDEAADAGIDMIGLLRTVLTEFRHLLVAGIEPALLGHDLADEDAAGVIERAQRYSRIQLLRALRLVGEGLSSARAFGQPRLELESALVRFALIEEDPTLEALGARLDALESASGSAAAPQKPRAVAESAPARYATAKPGAPKAAPAPKAGPAPQQPAETATATQPLSLQKIRASWQSVRSRVENERPPLAAPLARAQLDAYERGVLTIKLSEAWMADALREHGVLLENALAGILSEPVSVRFRVDEIARGGSSKNAVPPPGEPDSDLLQYARERISGRG